jgi:hypothetical protein
MTDATKPDDPPVPWVALVIGGAVMAFAVFGAFHDLGDDFVGWGVWVVGADVAHDALLAPALCGMGLVLARLVPGGWVRAHLQAGLIASGVVLLVAWVPLRGWGGNPGNPTIRPLDYRTATLTVLAVVWGVVALSAARHWWGTKRA